MSYNTVPTVATGDSWSASQHNIYIKDNFAAIWPFTDAGDIPYATASDTLDKISIGAAGTILGVNSSATAPEWAAIASSICILNRVDNQSINTASWTAIDWQNEEYDNASIWSTGTTITIPATGIYNITGFIRFSSNTTATREMRFLSQKLETNNATNGYDTILAFSHIGTYTALDSGTLEVYQGSGSSLGVIGRLGIYYLGST